MIDAGAAAATLDAQLDVARLALKNAGALSFDDDDESILKFTGRARVFTSEREAIAAIKGQSNRTIKAGDVLVTDH